MVFLVFYTWNTTKTPRKNVKKIGLKKSVSLGILIVILHISTSLIVPIQNFNGFNLVASSMAPSLLKGDHVMAVEKLEGENINAGDIVVFRLPSDMSIDYIQRVVGLPGDRVQVIEGILHINGDKVSRQQVGEIDVPFGSRNMRAILYEETFSNGHKHVIQELRDDLSFDNTPEFKVPEGHLFMMGDNRDNSRDSRSQAVGFVPIENLIGRAEFLFFSHNNTSRLFEFCKWPFAIRYNRIGKGIY